MRITDSADRRDRTEQEAQRRRARATQRLDRVRNRRSESPRALPVPRGCGCSGRSCSRS